MAKQTSVLQFRGKLGQVVGYGKSAKGQRYARARVVDIKNPRSDAQCIQRMIAATAAKTIAELRPILSNSAEGIKFGSRSLDYWRGRYMRYLRSAIANKQNAMFNVKGSYGIAPNTLPIASGSLASVPVSEVAFDDFFVNVVGRNTSSLYPTDIFPSVEVGNQITFVFLAYDITNHVMRSDYCRFAFKSAALPAVVDDHLNAQNIDLLLAEGRWDQISVKRVGSTRELSFIIQPSFFNFDTDGLFAAAVVVSDKQTNKRSEAALIIHDNFEWFIDASAPYQSYENAFRSYATDAAKIELVNDFYLQNSTEKVDTDPQVISTSTGDGIVSVDVDSPSTITLNWNGTTIDPRANVGFNEPIFSLVPRTFVWGSARLDISIVNESSLAIEFSNLPGNSLRSFEVRVNGKPFEIILKSA